MVPVVTYWYKRFLSHPKNRYFEVSQKAILRHLEIRSSTSVQTLPPADPSNTGPARELPTWMAGAACTLLKRWPHNTNTLLFLAKVSARLLKRPRRFLFRAPGLVPAKKQHLFFGCLPSPALQSAQV